MKCNSLKKISFLVILLNLLSILSLFSINTYAAERWSGEDLIKAAIKNSKDLFNADKNPVFYQVVNPDNKPVSSIHTVVVFYDYNCTYSRELIPLLRTQWEKKLYKIIFRPIGMTSDTSRTFAEFALAAYQVSPEKFLDLHYELANTRYILPMSTDNLRSAITKAGLKYDDLADIINKQGLSNVVMNNQVIYDNIRFPGVPSIILAKLDSNNNIINDKIYYIAGSDRSQLEYKLYRILN